ncbi:YciI family protein [Streptomyces sp. NPDC017936]|uniref:YciI family protein n=1 Tax=Streptomyces sp. NPDC017936 TaxID=3365016 RepID=UPI003792380E
MTYYLLSVVQPTGGQPPSAAGLDEIVRRVAAFDDELRAAGAWVFSGGLHAPETATVLRPEGDGVLVTDGPYAEGEEYLGGLCLIKAADPEEALEWGRKAALATTLPVEVRPFADTH